MLASDKDKIDELETEIALHRSTIDQELLAIAEKSRLRNALLPVSKLLPELLSIVFEVFAHNPSEWSDQGPYSWIVITHVCNQWREVALSSPRLWSYILMGSPERVELFLERSRQAPLTISVWSLRNDHFGPYYAAPRRPLQPSALAKSMRLILAQSHRIQSLHMELANNVLERVFDTFKDRGFHAPILNTLKVTAVAHRNTYDFPKILTSSSSPKLAHVEIRGYPAPWHCPFLRSDLTSLTIQYNFNISPPGLAIDVAELITCLSYMPRLRLLDVTTEYCCGQCSSSVSRELPPISLPCLEEVYLRLTPSSVDAFVTRCNFPSSARLQLDTTVRHDHPFQLVNNDFTLQSIVSNSIVLPTQSRIGDDKPLTGLSIQIHSLPLHGFENLGWGDHPSPALSPGPLCQLSVSIFQHDFNNKDKYQLPPKSLPPPHFLLRFSERSSSVVSVLSHLLHPLTLPDLTYLDLSGSPGCELSLIGKELGEMLSDLIRRCSNPCLEYLRLHGSASDVLPHTLTSFMDSDGALTDWSSSVNHKNSLFSRIRTLIFSDVASGSRWFTNDEDGWDETSINHLCTAVRDQAQLYKWSCGPFSTLVLEQVKESREWLDELIDSFHELLDQEGRFTTEVFTTERSPTPIGVWPPYMLPPQPLSPLPASDNPDDDLDRFGWVTPMAPTPIPALIDWRDHVAYKMVIFDLKGNQGIRFVDP